MTEQLVLDTPMIASAVVLVATFVMLFTEHVHHIHRTTIAMVGSGVMVLVGQYFGFYNPELALHAVDWNVVLLLGAMMTVVAIMVPTGGFQAVAYWVARFSKGRVFLLLVTMSTAISVLSMFLANVTVVAIFGPLIILMAQALRVSPVPHLMAAAIMSNIGGIATLVGDPPNLMIGSAADIDFVQFFLRMGGVVAVTWVVSFVVFRIAFRRQLSAKPQAVAFASEKMITDPFTWYMAIGVLVLMVGLFVLQGQLGWDAWVVSVVGLIILLAISYKASPDKFFADTELSLLAFFMGLFVIVGGVEHSEFLAWIGQFLRPMVEEHGLLPASLGLMWAGAILSAIIDNIPFTAAMIPIIAGMGDQGTDVMPLWWALAIGVGLGANGSHLGASPNLYVIALSERVAEKEGKPSLRITPGLFIKKGLIIMFAGLVTASIAFWLFFDFYAKPLPGRGPVAAQVETHKSEDLPPGIASLRENGFQAFDETTRAAPDGGIVVEVQPEAAAAE